MPRTTRLRVIAVWTCAALALGGAVAPLGAQESTVTIETLRGDVRPQIELLIPTGVVSQTSTIPAGVREFALSSRFNTFTGAVAARISVQRRVGRLQPYTRLSARLDNEPVFFPDFDSLSVIPDNRFVHRQRALAPGVRVPVGVGALWLEARLEENIELSVNGSDETQTVDLFPSIGWEIANLRRILPGASPETTGGALSTQLVHRLGVPEAIPIDLRWQTDATVRYRAWERWRVEHRGSADLPLAIWQPERSARSSYAGSDGVRGYLQSPVDAWRAVAVATTLERLVAGDLVVNPAEWDGSDENEQADEELRSRFHSVRIIGALDVALLQPERTALSPLRAVASVGVGAGLTVSLPNDIHFDVRSLVAIPAAPNPAPVFYLSTAVFSLTAAP